MRRYRLISTGGIGQWIKRLYLWITRKKCGTCVHYDGRFGDENYCFDCLHSMNASEYRRRVNTGRRNTWQV